MSTTDSRGHSLLLGEIQDWETACPYAELSDHFALYINGLQLSGNAPYTSNDPAFKLDGAFDYLRITNATVGPCGTAPYTLATISNAATTLSIGNSDINGTVVFNASAMAQFTGNRFLTGVCAVANSPATLANVVAAANYPAANCPNR